MTSNTILAKTLARVSEYLIDAGVNMNDAMTIVDYADKWGARIQFASTPANDEYIAVVLHDDHVFAAASSKLSQVDALHRLAGCIRAKAV